MTLPAPVNAPSDPVRPGPEELLAGYLAAQRARDAGNRRFSGAARVFLRHWPDPQVWAAQP